MSGVGGYFSFLDSFIEHVSYFLNDVVFRFDEQSFPIIIFVSLMIIGFSFFVFRRVFHG